MQDGYLNSGGISQIVECGTKGRAISVQVIRDSDGEWKGSRPYQQESWLSQDRKTGRFSFSDKRDASSPVGGQCGASG